MNLEKIGFYTLKDERARTINNHSPLARCEVILTEDCNFNCPYCRKLDPKYTDTMRLGRAVNLISMWAERNLSNIRFSGGEPTLYPNLKYLVRYAKLRGVKRIAISTNGTASLDIYKELIEVGVNDISFSLDACCALDGDKMSGTKGLWKKVAVNIKEVSKICYTTAGIVFNESNIDSLESTLIFAHSLGVHDIRVIPSAQFNQMKDLKIEPALLDKYPILKYRIDHIRKGINVRGLKDSDCGKCSLVLDDMAVLNKHHFPCIIYLREGGKPIGRTDCAMSETVRKERIEWFKSHNSHKDPICKKNCLDVCIHYNNRVRDLMEVI